MKIAALFPMCAFLTSFGTAHAQVALATYSFTNQSSTTMTLTASSVAPNVSAGLFAISDGSFTTTNFTTGGPFNSPAVADSGSWDAATPTKYFSFTITPATGYQISLADISFDYRQTASGALNFRIDVGANTNVASGTFTRDSVWYSETRSLTTTTLTGPTEIRIYGYGGGAGSFGIDEVTLRGTASAIPEPSTYAALAGGAALVGAIWWRRRHPPPRP